MEHNTNSFLLQYLRNWIRLYTREKYRKNTYQITHRIRANKCVLRVVAKLIVVLVSRKQLGQGVNLMGYNPMRDWFCKTEGVETKKKIINEILLIKIFKWICLLGCCIGEYTGGFGCVDWISIPWETSDGCCCHPNAW